MTDKQIIYGVDVSGCSYGEIEKGIFKCSCEYNVRSASMFCKDNPGCYYKQLKRKEQECEELKKELMKKDEVNTFFNTPIDGWSSNPCEICPYKAENEQLKEELSVIQHNCNREGCKYYDDNTFKVFYECKAQKALQLSANSVTTKYCDLLKTLAEIKEIAENVQSFVGRIDIEDDVFEQMEQILQKISEVADEN